MRSTVFNKAVALVATLRKSFPFWHFFLFLHFWLVRKSRPPAKFKNLLLNKTLIKKVVDRTDDARKLHICFAEKKEFEKRKRATLTAFSLSHVKVYKENHLQSCALHFFLFCDCSA